MSDGFGKSEPFQLRVESIGRFEEFFCDGHLLFKCLLWNRQGFMSRWTGNCEWPEIDYAS